jgi:cytoskeletal protein CcmA (bactofilin family)
MTLGGGWWQVNDAYDSVGAMSQTVIGPSTRIAGALAGQDDLVVEGTVDGPIFGEASVTIKVGARVNGEVRGRDVTVAGELSHAVFATGVVRLMATAKLTGDIEAPRISIDEGATFEGRVRMTKPGAQKAQPAIAPQPVIAPQPSIAPQPTIARQPAIAPQPVAGGKTQPFANPSANTASAPVTMSMVQAHDKIVQAHHEREIPELAAPGRKRLIRKTT